ncbi:hypothetical protein QMG61_05205 [Cryobacterium sp. PH31-AA6]|uniref:hypothetical protein n=1 Tax=Cryobacterium sp. PH31-AA6 TaxID=3046205 RepID=UPI0024B9C1A0|nr:hypothetical protein [Cryobacterium sp. PH31-AA6]MDJ0323160.1 hypothetical protein [Cryobacterium sp. PH31-AA6]
MCTIEGRLMAGGFPAGGSEVQKLLRNFTDIFRRLRELETPTGTQTGSLVAQVQAALVNINATVTAAITALSYTRAEIDSKVASPGPIAPTTVTASDTITAGGVLTADAGMSSLDVRNRLLSSSYVSVYADSSGRLGYVPSSLNVKTVTGAYTANLEDWLEIEPQFFYYNDDETQTPRVGFIAEWVNTHFPEFVVHDEVEGRVGTFPAGIHYEFMIAGMQSAFQQYVSESRAHIQALETRVTNLGG